MSKLATIIIISISVLAGFAWGWRARSFYPEYLDISFYHEGVLFGRGNVDLPQKNKTKANLFPSFDNKKTGFTVSRHAKKG